MEQLEEPRLGPLFGSDRAASKIHAAAAESTRRSQLPAAALRELEFDGRPANAPRSTADEIEDGVVINVASIVSGLRAGTDAQKSLLLFEVQQLLSHAVSGEFALKTIVPVICDEVKAWTHDLRICAAEALVGMQVAKLPHGMAISLCETAFEVLRSHYDADSFRAWGEILVRILPHAQWSEAELHTILVYVDELNKMDNTSSGVHAQVRLGGSHRQHSPVSGMRSDLATRLTARIVGPIAVSASVELTQEVLLPRALLLAAESDEEVRGMVVESLAYIASAVDVSSVEHDIWPTLISLLQDTSARLHAATLKTISRVSATHRTRKPDSYLFRELVPPVLVRECHYLRRHANADQRLVDDSTYLLIEINSEIFGELLFSTSRFLSDDSIRKDAFKAYQAMATCNGPIVRRHCAFNMPGVALSLSKRHRADMASIAEFLSRDADPETRWSLAAGMHETAKILCDSDTIETLFKTVNALLHDESPLVRMNVLQNLDNLLGTLSSHNPLKASKRLESVFQNLQLLSEGNWRTQELLAKQMRLVAPLVPPQCIRENVLPLLYQLTDESSYTVRKAAMGAVAVCMRCIPDTTERDTVMENFRLQWGRGPVFWMRLGFIDSSEVALETYSRILFRDTFGAELLRLANDPVVNVRIRIAQVMPKIAPACHQMDEYNTTLERLSRDSQLDIQSSLLGIQDMINCELELARENFEGDMMREAAEQDLYSKHLQLMAEAHKKRTAMRHKTNAILGVLSPRNAGNTIASGALGKEPIGTSNGGQHSTCGEQTEIDSPKTHKVPRSATLAGRAAFHGSKLPRGATFSGTSKSGTVSSSSGSSSKPGIQKHGNPGGASASDKASSRTARTPTLGGRLGRRPKQILPVDPTTEKDKDSTASARTSENDRHTDQTTGEDSPKAAKYSRPSWQGKASKRHSKASTNSFR